MNGGKELVEKNFVQMKNRKIPVYSVKTAVVGSGAAGLNAAKRLYDFGQNNIAILTEGLEKGTSRNTGSDKQTYYKLSLSGQIEDSVADMAETYYEGGAMHGDIAQVEAALSPRAFFHLVETGVPFPHTEHGEYIGYKTDHDPARRATSAGPLTSHYMTINLEREIKKRNIDIFDKHQVIGILTSESKSAQNDEAVGLIALNQNRLSSQKEHLVLINCSNIIYAVGGPAKIYDTSVYPQSQTGASGIAFEAGVKGRNLTESQFGLASIGFRWNLSGTYQQVIPRYISTDQNGNNEKEFLKDYFSSPEKMINAIFLKGYQWPFDPRKVMGQGSSLIDILVYLERVIKNRRVWLDFTKNPSWACKEDKNELMFNLLNEEAFQYLDNSDACFGRPIDRLQKMNQPAVDLYLENDIDLSREKLEIAVCAQHNNGGLKGNKWWESNIEHFFPVGEVNGTHGVYRPGGAALNSGQVGGLRAAEYIVNNYDKSPLQTEEFLNLCEKQVRNKISMEENIINNTSGQRPQKILSSLQKRMTEKGGFIRSLENVEKSISETKNQLTNYISNIKIDGEQELNQAFHIYDYLITQFVYLNAIRNYIKLGGKSRGSYLITDKNGRKPLNKLPETFRYSLDQGKNNKYIQLSSLDITNWDYEAEWIERRPLPQKELWFEKEWKKFRNEEIY